MKSSHSLINMLRELGPPQLTVLRSRDRYKDALRFDSCASKRGWLEVGNAILWSFHDVEGARAVSAVYTRGSISTQLDTLERSIVLLCPACICSPATQEAST